MKELGVNLIPSYSPQARGRSERNFSTWQGRLPQELRLRGIGIDVVVLVRLHVRLHILRRHQAHIMALFPKSTAEKMGSSAGLHANQAMRKVRGKAQQLSS